MDEATSLADRLSDSANEFWDTFGGYLPEIFGALVLLVVAVLVAKLAQTVVVKGLELVQFDKLVKNKYVAKTLKTAEVTVDVASVLGRIAFWVVVIIFALSITDVLQLDAMREVIAAILAYLPNVLAAIVVLTVTVAGARLARDVIEVSLARMKVDFASNMASLAFYVIVIFGSLMTLDQLGVDTTILSANLSIIVSGIVLALALAFGLGGKDVAGRIVEDAYKRAKRLNK